MDKFIKTLFVLLVIVLMILWLILCLETTVQISEVQTRLERGRSSGELQRRFIMPLNHNQMALFTQSTLPRMFALAVFGTLVEECICLLAIITLMCSARRGFMIALTLLTMIWFIQQYRIADFYHHIDSIDLQSSQMIIASHLIHLIIIILGSISLFVTNRTEDHHDRLIAKHKNSNLEASSTKDRLIRRCEWVRSTLGYSNHSGNSDKPLDVADDEPDQPMKPGSKNKTANQNGHLIKNISAVVSEQQQHNRNTYQNNETVQEMI